MSVLILLTAVAVVGCFSIHFLNCTDISKIKHLPEIPGAPIFGNLIQLRNCHAKAAQLLARKYDPVFQARLGSRRVVFVNSFDAVKALGIANQNSPISRPRLHTFDTVVSGGGEAIFSSENFTVGSSPWDKPCKRRRKAISSAVNTSAIQSYMPSIDLEFAECFQELVRDSEFDDIHPKPYIQRIALNMALTLNYGTRVGSTVNDSLFREITHV